MGCFAAGALWCGGQILDPAEHARVVGAAPEDLAALRAAAEVVFGLACVGREQVGDFLFGH